jgi:hypothetical protein
MLNENILWARAISPTGRLIKEPTLLGAVLIGLFLFVGFSLIVFLGSLL